MRGILWLADRTLDAVFPRWCVLCRREIDDGDRRALCRPCEEALPLIRGEGCRRCGSPAGRGARAPADCPDCRGHKELRFDGATAAGVYGGTLRDLVLEFKFRGGHYLVDDLVAILARRIEEADAEVDIDALVPVPLHRSRLRERGYNQSAILARALGRRLGIPALAGRLVKIRATNPQADLEEADRRKNQAGAFEWRGKEPAPEGVLLVDDVLTTGATASECARVLRAHGAKRVHVAVLAR